MTLPARVFSLVPEAFRKQTEAEFGARVERLIARAGVRVVDVARSLGLRDTKLYAAFRGTEHFRAAWLELLPPAVERLYLEERAAHHGCTLAPVGDAAGAGSRFHALVVELGDVTRAAAEGEADGQLSVADCERELAEITQAKRALADREALLRRVASERGAPVRSPLTS